MTGWEDWVLSGRDMAGIAVLALLSRDREKPSLRHCVLAVGLAVAAVPPFLSKGLWKTACTATIVGVLWVVITYRKTREQLPLVDQQDTVEDE